MIILAAIVFRGQFFDCQVFVNIMLLNTTAQNSLALKQIWETIDTDSCPGNYNFHEWKTGSLEAPWIHPGDEKRHEQ